MLTETHMEARRGSILRQETRKRKVNEAQHTGMNKDLHFSIRILKARIVLSELRSRMDIP